MTSEVKVVTCCPKNRFYPRDGKNQIKSPVHLFELNFFTQRALYNHGTFICSEFFYLSCRSTPKKFFTTCCSVFHRFCHVLSLLNFSNLKISFCVQKPFGNLDTQYLFKNIVISSKGKIVILWVLTSL